MKTAVIFTLSALSTAGLFCASAFADEPMEPSLKSGNLAHLFMRSGAEAPSGGFAVLNHAKLEPVGMHAVTSDQKALVSGLTSTTLVIDGASLLVGDRQEALRAANVQGAGTGFAPIKAALAAPSVVSVHEIRSADPGALRSLNAPSK